MASRLMYPASFVLGFLVVFGCESRSPNLNVRVSDLPDTSSVPGVDANSSAPLDSLFSDADILIPSSVVRDSLGIQIVENGNVREMSIAFRIVPTPIRDLGGMKSNAAAELKSHATYLDVIKLGDSRYAVGNASELTVFSPSGEYLLTIGREGQGPGEFRQVRMLCTAPGDTIIAVDSRMRRFSVFDSSGTHVRTITPTAMMETEGCLSDGSLLLRGESRPNPVSSLPEAQATYLDRVATIRRISVDGVEVGVVGVLPVDVLHPEFSYGQGIVPHGDVIYAGNGFLPEYRVYGVDGTLLRIVRWEAPLIPATDQMLGQAFSVPPGSTASKEQMLAGLRTLPLPNNLPVFSDLIVDPHGRVWTADGNYNEGRKRPSSWTVFDASGKIIGQVLIPEIPGASFSEILTVFEEEVVIRWRDDLGFNHVSFHLLEAVARR